jgi:3',5'-cyclic AMP phosphodiesterase CpdA
VTGDITDNAQHKDFELARKIFRSYKLLDPARMSVVIGNHDIFGGIHLAEEILDFPQRCKKTPYHKKISLFREAFDELFQGCRFSDNRNPFPYFKPVGDILLIGLNSVAEYSSVKNPVGSNGRVSDQQIRQLDLMLSSNEFKQPLKIVLIHHHFQKTKKQVDGTMHSLWGAIENQTMKLRGKKELIKLFNKHSIRLVVHGHQHENMEYAKNGIRFFNGGATVLNNGPSLLNINIIKIQSNNIHTERCTLVADSSPEKHHAAISELPSYISAAAV